MQANNIHADEQRNREKIDDLKQVMYNDAVDLNRRVDVTMNHGARAANIDDIGSCHHKRLNCSPAQQSIKHCSAEH